MEKYYQVHGYCKSNFASFDSPKFETYYACIKWINERVFDAGMKIEIREVEALPVDSPDYDKFDVCKYECTDSQSRMLWERGCLCKSELKLRDKA